MKRHYNIPIFLPHAACPFRCVFCEQHLITSSLKIPTPQEVTSQIRTVLETIPREGAEVEVAFFGGNFTALPKMQQQAYLEVVQPFLAEGQVQRIRCSTRPDCVEPEGLLWLKRCGMEVVELGVQSFDAGVLRASGRGYSPEQAETACRYVREAGMRLGVQLMPGLPQDTLEKSVMSAEMAVKLQADMARIYPTVVLKGTALETLMRRGSYQPLTIEMAIEMAYRMQLVFEAADIPVIRLGLYAGEDLQDPQNVCGGAFHPSLGERVTQRIFLEQAGVLLKRAGFLGEEALTLFVNRREVSKMTGWKRENMEKLHQEYFPTRFQVRGVEHMEIGEIGVGYPDDREPQRILTRREYLHAYCR